MSNTRKKAKWTITDAGRAIYQGVSGLTADFSITDLFPCWDKMDKVERFLSYYGMKQNLADSIADIGKGATDAMKVDGMQEKYALLISGETTKKTVRAKRVTKSEFMAKAETEGYTEAEAEKFWDMFHSK